MVEVTCTGCGLVFKVSPSRKATASFCTRACYDDNQHKRRGRVTSDEAPLVGRRFDRLVVMERARGTGRYLCRCDCGGSGLYNRGALLQGRVRSCGCFNREKKRIPGQESAWRAWFRYLTSQAKRRGLPFTLTDDEVRQLCQQTCTYCGSLPSPWEGWKKAYLRSCSSKNTESPDLDFAASKVILLNGLDRLDASLGYEPSNVTPCCWRCNTAKLDFSVEEFKAWVGRVHARFTNR